ncbi:hypothetical protein HBI56_031570 [Parastagonospora nodorum]|nr:hypothetical protein HBH51_174430 [Parastagonospora nodorum]KAH4034811.1 hypothetical protein HBI09_103480 [Parastagonospora nodorum]KAH4059280.1 hypothetical protein HBH49_016100 [Parastagonospora nodorum]KAH4074736.1 hypothetical protein HBH50_029130 [Parastagonospora nodorum]KAH4096796.1 hypothetical protein HBH48_038010 [Parastagonospora nodorum]
MAITRFLRGGLIRCPIRTMLHLTINLTISIWRTVSSVLLLVPRVSDLLTSCRRSGPPYAIQHFPSKVPGHSVCHYSVHRFMLHPELSHTSDMYPVARTKICIIKAAPMHTLSLPL